MQTVKPQLINFSPSSYFLSPYLKFPFTTITRRSVALCLLQVKPFVLPSDRLSFSNKKVTWPVIFIFYHTKSRSLQLQNFLLSSL